jgi:hypothetical protein
MVSSEIGLDSSKIDSNSPGTQDHLVRKCVSWGVVCSDVELT